MKFQFNNSNITINVSQKEFARISDVLIGGDTTIPVNTFTLTDNELYMMKCILHHVNYNGPIKSLLDKFAGPDDEDFTAKDYDKVVFERDVFGDNVINFVENN